MNLALLLERSARAFPRLPAVALGARVLHDYPALLDAAPMEAAEVAAPDLAWPFYTSGTTGMPKGVMLTHGNLLAATLAYFSDVDTIAPGEAILHAAPMSHGSGLCILPHVAKAACNVVPESGGFDEAEIFDLLRHHRGVTMFAAPTMVKRLVAHAEQARPGSANLKTLVYGGGTMYVEDCKAALRDRSKDLIISGGSNIYPREVEEVATSLSSRCRKIRPERC